MANFTKFHELSTNVLVSEQIQPEDLALAREIGVDLIVNNRPDGESPEQPDGRRIAEAADAVGLDYAAIPISNGFSAEQVGALAQLLDRSNGKTLLYCRSGTRSTLLWALARASAGEPVAAIAAAAQRAGYSVAPVADALDELAAQAGDADGG